MKTCLSTLVMCLAASTAIAQLLPTPEADKPPADKDKPAPVDGAAEAGGPADRRGPGGPAGPGAQGDAGALRGAMGRMSNPLFEAIDADSDGMITKVELRKAVAQFKKLDTDQDGNISLAEVSPQGGPIGPMAAGGPAGQFGDPNQMVDRLMQSDRNGDGKLTADELPGQMAQQMIQNGDRDGDGALSKLEVAQAMQNMQNRFGNWPGGLQGGNFPVAPGAFQGGAVGADQRQMMGQMLQWDRNGDGKLSPDEVPRQARGMLQDGDQNRDGVIDAMEMRLAIERNGERMRGALGRARNGQDNDAKGENADGDSKRRDRRSDRDN